MNKNDYTTWLEIDLGAIENNVRQLLNLTGVPVMAVIKANGYGHGMVEVARAAEEAGSTWCGVARFEEALALRQAGIKTHILVLGFTPPGRVPEALHHDISLAVFNPDVAAAYAACALDHGASLKVHVKFDSGMGRLGLFPEDGLEILKQLASLKGIEVEGLFTHFARADEPLVDTTGQQLERFTALVQSVEQQGLRPRWVHAANSAATLYFPQARFDLVRCGVAIYGLHPSAKAPLPPDFRPALSLKTHLISVKTLPAQYGISYGHHYYTRDSERIGVIPIGYGDGFRRRLGAEALIRGRRVAVRGITCMDLCMISLDEVPDAEVGDEVVLIGCQGEAAITAEDLAQEWGTINYEVVCGMARRIPRFYQH